jgi:4'-phosphopantetheinyl transferase
MLDTEPIEIWRVLLDGWLGRAERYTASQIVSWRSVLSREEQMREDAFHGEEHSRDYIVAHVALRTVLGGRLGVSPAKVEFADGSFHSNGMHGQAAGRIKPSLQFSGASVASSGLQELSGHELDLRFNLSHTRGAALIAVARGRELGVDIEQERPMADLEAMAASVMSHGELGGWLAIPEEDQERAFYRLWTRKEAYLKAIGLGLFRSLQEVTVPVIAEALDRERVHLVQDLATAGVGEGVWQVLDVEAGSGFAAAVSVAGAGAVRLTVRDLNL